MLALTDAIRYVCGSELIRGEANDMADYYTFLARKIQETNDDPAKRREVVYDAARLALRWQVQGQWPRLSTIEANRQVSELEEAIARLEANTAGPGVLGNREPGNAAAALEAKGQSHNPSEEDDVEEPHPQPRAPPGPKAVAGSLGALGNGGPDNAAAGFKIDAPSTFEESHPQPTSAALAGLEAVARSLGGPGEREPHDAAAGSKASWQSRDGPGQAPEPESEDVPRPRAPPSAELAGPKAVMGSLGGRGNGGPGHAPASFNASRQSRNAPIESRAADVPGTFRGAEPPDPFSAKPPGSEAAVKLGGRGNREPRKAAARFTASRQSRKEDDGPDTVEEPTELPWAEPADVEVEAAGPSGHKREPGKAVASFKASRQRRYVSIDGATTKSDFVFTQPESGEDDTSEDNPPPWHSAPTGSRELVLVRDRARSSTYVVNPVDFVNPDVTYVGQPRARMVLLGLTVAFQLAVAALAVAAFYVVMWGRHNPVQTAGEMLLSHGQTPSVKPAAPTDQGNRVK
jgi:hypothetical protein